MMTQVTTLQNPYEDYGSIVYGDRFVGRQEGLRVISNRVTGPRDGGSLAIVGLPHIGKSSLLWQALIHNEKSLVERQILPIWINLATFNNGAALFHSFVSQMLNKLEDVPLGDARIMDAGQEVLQTQGAWSEVFEKIQRFFKRVRGAGWRPVIVLDEFDAARILFREQLWAFQSLRELGYNPSCKVVFVIVSRRSIKEIEEQSAGISTFDNIVHKYYVPMFSPEETEQLINRLATVGIEVTDEIRQCADKMCGGHPFLLERLCYQIADDWLNRRAFNLRELCGWKGVGSDFYDYYGHLIDLWEENSSLSKLLEIVFGPQVSATQVDADNFARYRIIKEGQGDYYVPFSEHFHSFLRLKERETDLWPLWCQTERALRALVTKVLIGKYDDNWADKLVKAKPNVKDIIEGCKERQLKERQAFGAQASSNLFDFAYPSDFFAIISCEWSEFAPVLKRDKAYWNQRFALISKVRNPMAHNRDLAIKESERLQAEGFCKEILDCISSST